MHGVSARLVSRERICNRQAAVRVPVPVNSHVLACGFHHFLANEIEQRANSARRRMPDGITDNDGARATFDGRRVELLDRLRPGASGVLGAVHGRQAQTACEFHRTLRGLQQEVKGPVLGILPDRTRAQKSGSFDLQPCGVGDLSNRRDVGFDGASRTVWLDPHLCRDDLARQLQNIVLGPRPCPGQPQVKRVDAQFFHQVQDLDLLIYRRVEYGG